MKICVIGGGLAGALLAWRIAQASSRHEVVLLADRRGDGEAADATEASGGGVRGYETHPVQRRLAVDSLSELLSSKVLRDWADYRRTGSAYLRDPEAGLGDELAELDDTLPGSVELRDVGELRRLGWAGLPEAVVAVAERFAGYISPARLRRKVLQDLASQRRASVWQTRACALTPRTDGSVSATAVDGSDARFDVAVVAAGPWTPALLRASGLPAEGYRTKSIQYAIHRIGDWRPPVFVDETSGLFGRPTADGCLLLGLPTQAWGAAPGPVPNSDRLHERAAQMARTRFPKLRLGTARSRVSVSDCYTDQPVLRLRPIGAAPRLFTFTGGSGASVKTALAASRLAAAQLVDH